nr:MAG TPA: hypothetical protein [Caudoviricetes sp.]
MFSYLSYFKYPLSIDCYINQQRQATLSWLY